MAKKRAKGTIHKAGVARSKGKFSVGAVVERLKELGSQKVLDGYARFAIPTTHALGIPVGVLQAEAKNLGKNHELALGLWRAKWYEARMLAVFLDKPDLVTPEQMDQWCEDFDSWAICDTACFHLFDRTPYAPAKVKAWAQRKEEFVRRASFALMASVALHDKKREDDLYYEWLPIIEKWASDERNFVKKGISWALRGIGRRSAGLFTASMALGAKLAGSENGTERWIGKDVVRDLAKVQAKRRAKG